MKINLIAARSLNNVIGNNNLLPWNFKSDLKWFKNMTTDSTVIMGRITFESLDSKPLKNRVNIVISSTNIVHPDIIVCRCLKSALHKASFGDRPCFIIGGYNLFKEGLEFADNIYLTEIQKDFDGDVFFPEIPSSFKKEQINLIIEEDTELIFNKYYR